MKYLQTMIECLCMLGKVAAAGAMIWFAPCQCLFSLEINAFALEDFVRNLIIAINICLICY